MHFAVSALLHCRAVRALARALCRLECGGCSTAQLAGATAWPRRVAAGALDFEAAGFVEIAFPFWGVRILL